MYPRRSFIVCLTAFYSFAFPFRCYDHGYLQGARHTDVKIVHIFLLNPPLGLLPLACSNVCQLAVSVSLHSIAASCKQP